MIYIKIHESYRKVVAICDVDLMGKKFEEDIRQLEIKEHFFKGSEFSKEEAISVIINQAKEDATFNIVGEESTSAAIEAGIITKNSISKIQGIPFALVLL